MGGRRFSLPEEGGVIGSCENGMALFFERWMRWGMMAGGMWMWTGSVGWGADAGLHALLVGGGPDREDNTAQIEEHLRFVTSLVPVSRGRVVLFADGKAGSRDLSYTDESQLTAGQRALDVLLPNDGLGAKVETRTPRLGTALDGPARLGAIDKGMRRLAGMSGPDGPPVLLYFAGHGSQSERKDGESLYSLWGDEDLDAGTLLGEMDELPPRVRVTVVMAQCFSGGFGNMMFKDANGDGGMNERLMTGFFAAESDREAAGCGTDTGSPLYQDFSSYFFGALSGRDKLGNVVEGADYDGDGKVSCYEAMCYAMIHDESIDTPVCTSMLYLRRFANVDDGVIFTTPYSKVLETATPGQRAVLEGLSARLGVTGEGRVLAAYDRLMFADPMGQAGQLRAYRDAQDRLNGLRMDNLHALFVRWPALRWRGSHDYDKATKGAAAELTADGARRKGILDAEEAFDRADAALDTEEGLLVRYTDMAEAVVRARYLREHGDGGTKGRFEEIWKAEQEGLPIVMARKGAGG